MLSYYIKWNYVFDSFPEFKAILLKMKKENQIDLPDTINREEMKFRGQMGSYWNSLTKFGIH